MGEISRANSLKISNKCVRTYILLIIQYRELNKSWHQFRLNCNMLKNAANMITFWSIDLFRDVLICPRPNDSVTLLTPVTPVTPPPDAVTYKSTRLIASSVAALHSHGNCVNADKRYCTGLLLADYYPTLKRAENRR